MSKESLEILLTKHSFVITSKSRSILFGHDSCILWFTGLSGSGKSTIANEVERSLHRRGIATFVLDGDAIRLGLCKDLGFDLASRSENIRRVAEVAKLMAEAGFVVLVCFISPLEVDRQSARAIAVPHRFLEIYVKSSLEEAEKRDPKGLYKLARSGAIRNFTGIDSPYEVPPNPDIILDTEALNSDQCVRVVLRQVSNDRSPVHSSEFANKAADEAGTQFD